MHARKLNTLLPLEKRLLIPVFEAQAVLTMSEDFLYKLMDAGIIKYTHRGRFRMVLVSSLLDYVRESVETGREPKVPPKAKAAE
jgi:hypothetical protein